MIEFDGDSARSKSYWDAVGDMKGEAMVAAGFYEDTLRRVDGKWKYIKKIIRIDYMVPLRDGWGGKHRIKCRLIQGLAVDTAGWRRAMRRSRFVIASPARRDHYCERRP